MLLSRRLHLSMHTIDICCRNKGLILSIGSPIPTLVMSRHWKGKKVSRVESWRNLVAFLLTFDLTIHYLHEQLGKKLSSNFSTFSIDLLRVMVYFYGCSVWYAEKTAYLTSRFTEPIKWARNVGPSKKRMPKTKFCFIVQLCTFVYKRFRELTPCPVGFTQPICTEV